MAEDPEREARFKEYDGMGELEVRRYLAEGRLSEKNTRLANSWLQSLESVRDERMAVERASHLEAAKSAASAATIQALEARRANEIAQRANITATLALIAAVIAIAISIIGIFVGRH